MEKTPERKAYPVRGTIKNNVINLSNIADNISISSKKSQRSHHKHSIASSHSDGAASFKPQLSSKPEVLSGDVPGLGKKYDPTSQPTTRHIQSQKELSQIHNMLSESGSRGQDSQGTGNGLQSLGKSNFGQRYSVPAGLSFQPGVVDMAIMRSEAMQSHNPPQSNPSEHESKSSKTMIQIEQERESISSFPAARSDQQTLQVPQDQKREQNQVRGMISPMHDPKLTDYHRNDLWTTTNRPKPAKKHQNFASVDVKAVQPMTTSQESDKHMENTDETPSMQPSLTPSISLTPPLARNGSVEDGIGLDFRKIKDSDMMSSNAYTITHRAGGMEMQPDLSMTPYSNIGMSITSKLERQYEDYARNAQVLLSNIPEEAKESEEKQRQKEKIPPAIMVKDASVKSSFTQKQPIKGIVQIDLDVDAIVKQAKSKKKKSKKKRVKAQTNQDSYTYYSESTQGFPNTTSQIDEDPEDDVQIKLTPTINVERTAFGTSPSTHEKAATFGAGKHPDDTHGGFDSKAKSTLHVSPKKVFVKQSDGQGSQDSSGFQTAGFNSATNFADGSSPNNYAMLRGSINKAQDDMTLELNQKLQDVIKQDSSRSYQQMQTDPSLEELKKTSSFSSKFSLQTSESVKTFKGLQPAFLKEPSLKPVGDVPKHFKPTGKPAALKQQVKGQGIVKYELGSSAIELMVPNYAKVYKGKLKHIVRLQNGEPAPSFVKAKVTQSGQAHATEQRLVIRIYQEDAVGVDAKYPLMLNVYHTDTGIYDTQLFTLQVKAKKKLELTALNFEPDLKYSLNSAEIQLPLPTYNVANRRLTQSLEYQNGTPAPQFVHIVVDLGGAKSLIIQSTDQAEIGEHELVIVAKDNVSGVVNKDAKFKITVSKGIEIAELPAAFKDVIVVQRVEPQVIIDGPSFKKSADQDLRFQVVDDEDQPAEQVEVLANSDGKVQLKMDTASDWKSERQQTFKLIVNDATSGTRQILPFKVQVQMPKPELQLASAASTKASYRIGSNAIELPVPSYKLKHGQMSQQPEIKVITADGQSLFPGVALTQDDQGQRYVRVQTDDASLTGNYSIKLLANDLASGTQNAEAEFQIQIEEPALQLLNLPPAFGGNKTIYMPGKDPILIDVPDYKAVSGTLIKLSLANTQGGPAPSFVKLDSVAEKQIIVIHGKAQPEDKVYEVVLHVDEVSSGCQETHSLFIQGIPILLKLLKFEAPQTIEFNVGAKIIYPLPSYTRNNESQLVYSLSAISQLLRIENGKIVIEGGTSSDRGTYEVTVVATEPVTGINNKEVKFELKVIAKLILDRVPECFKEDIIVQIGEVREIEVPNATNSKNIEYSLTTLNCSQDQQNVVLNFHYDGLPKIVISTGNFLSQDVFDMELTLTDRELDISESLLFTVRFNLVPAITLLSKPDDFAYTIGAEAVEFDMPVYETYPIKDKVLNISIEAKNETAICLLPVNRVDDMDPIRLQFFTIDSITEGIHTITIVATDQDTEVVNRDAVITVTVFKPLVVKVSKDQSNLESHIKIQDQVSSPSEQSATMRRSKLQRKRTNKSLMNQSAVSNLEQPEELIKANTISSEETAIMSANVPVEQPQVSTNAPLEESKANAMKHAKKANSILYEPVLKSNAKMSNFEPSRLSLTKAHTAERMKEAQPKANFSKHAKDSVQLVKSAPKAMSTTSSVESVKKTPKDAIIMEQEETEKISIVEPIQPIELFQTNSDIIEQKDDQIIEVSAALPEEEIKVTSPIQQIQEARDKSLEDAKKVTSGPLKKGSTETSTFDPIKVAPSKAHTAELQKTPKMANAVPAKESQKKVSLIETVPTKVTPYAMEETRTKMTTVEPVLEMKATPINQIADTKVNTVMSHEETIMSKTDPQKKAKSSIGQTSKKDSMKASTMSEQTIAKPKASSVERVNDPKKDTVIPIDDAKTSSVRPQVEAVVKASINKPLEKVQASSIEGSSQAETSSMRLEETKVSATMPVKAKSTIVQPVKKSQTKVGSYEPRHAKPNASSVERVKELKTTNDDGPIEKAQIHENLFKQTNEEKPSDRIVEPAAKTQASFVEKLQQFEASNMPSETNQSEVKPMEERKVSAKKHVKAKSTIAEAMSKTSTKPNNFEPMKLAQPKAHSVERIQEALPKVNIKKPIKETDFNTNIIESVKVPKKASNDGLAKELITQATRKNAVAISVEPAKAVATKDAVKSPSHFERLTYQKDLNEFLTSTKPKPEVAVITMDRVLNENCARPPTPTYSDNARAISAKNSVNFGSDADDLVNDTLPDGVKHCEIQDPTASIAEHFKALGPNESSDEAISDMSKIVRQPEYIEDEDVMRSLAPEPKSKTEKVQKITPRKYLTNQDQRRVAPSKSSPNRNLFVQKSSQCHTPPNHEKYSSVRDEKVPTMSARQCAIDQMNQVRHVEPDDPVQKSLSQFQQQLQAMQALQQQQIAAHQASHQLLLMQQRMAEQTNNQSLNVSQVAANNSLRQASSMIQDIKLQEDVDLNQQIKLQIQQSIQRRQQQQATLEQLQTERNHLRQQNHGDYRTIYDHTGQLREKDRILQQLKIELQQSWDERARFRAELNALQQREDDLQAEIFLNDNQIKSTSMRNQELSTRISETQRSQERSGFVSKSWLDEKSDNMLQISRDEYGIESKMHTAAQRLERLKHELDQLNEKISQSEAQIEYGRSKVGALERQVLSQSFRESISEPLLKPILGQNREKKPKNAPKAEEVENLEETFRTDDLVNESYTTPSRDVYQLEEPPKHVRHSSYRPRDNNIFGSANDDFGDRNRFQTTYGMMTHTPQAKNCPQVKSKPQQLMPAQIFIDDHEPITAGMRSDYKQRKQELHERAIQQQALNSGRSNNPAAKSQPVREVVNDERTAKLRQLNLKFTQDRAKLIKMLQSSSTGAVVRRQCEQQLKVIEDKIAIVQGKLSKC